jgi:hypothetical protein
MMTTTAAGADAGTNNPLPPDDPDKCARFWFYQIGVNVTPQPTKSRDPTKFNDWKEWQNKPIPEATFEQ